MTQQKNRDMIRYYLTELDTTISNSNKEINLTMRKVARVTSSEPNEESMGVGEDFELKERSNAKQNNT